MSNNKKVSIIFLIGSFLQSHEAPVAGKLLSALPCIEAGRERFFKQIGASELSFLRKYILCHTFNSDLLRKEFLLQTLQQYHDEYDILHSQPYYSQAHELWLDTVTDFKKTLICNAVISSHQNKDEGKPKQKRELQEIRNMLGAKLFHSIYEWRINKVCNYLSDKVSCGKNKYRKFQPHAWSLQKEYYRLCQESTGDQRAVWIEKLIEIEKELHFKINRQLHSSQETALL